MQAQVAIVQPEAALRLRLAERAMCRPQQGAQAHWQPDCIRVHLDNPRALPRLWVIHDRVPEPDEDIGVESSAPVPTHLGAQASVDKRSKDLWLFTLRCDPQALITVDSPFVARKETKLA